MFSALALAALTAVPAQGGQLKLDNVRMTVGVLGPTRKDAKFLPGDVILLRFDINGITIAANGETRYKMESRIVDKNNKLKFHREPQEKLEVFQLRGSTIPGAALFVLGVDYEPGIYTIEITVEDPKTKTKDTLSTKYEVLKPDFGIVQLHATADPGGGIPISNTYTVGQNFVLWYTVTSFERDPKTKQPKLELQVQLFDDKGIALLPEPLKGKQEEADEKTQLVTFDYPLQTNRAGKFSIQITATDKISNKKATIDWPFTVLAEK
jgi:hypothetical protein